MQFVIPKTPVYTRRQCGFTLVEIIVVTGILLILSGFAYSAFRDYEQKQKMTDEARRFKVALRNLQAIAQTGNKANTTCQSMNYVAVTITATTLTGTISCEQNSPANPVVSLQLARDMQIVPLNGNPLPSFHILTLSRGIATTSNDLLTGSQFFCIQAYGQYYKLGINAVGDILDNGLVSVCQ